SRTTRRRTSSWPDVSRARSTIARRQRSTRSTCDSRPAARLPIRPANGSARPRTRLRTTRTQPRRPGRSRAEGLLSDLRDEVRVYAGAAMKVSGRAFRMLFETAEAEGIAPERIAEVLRCDVAYLTH